MAVGLDKLINKKEHACLYTKNQSYKLLEAVERALTVHSHFNLNPDIISVSSGSTDIRIDEDEKHRLLRLGLLGIFSGAVIQENADIGFTKVKFEEANKMNKRIEYSKNSSVEKKKNENALNMLTASAFL